MGLLSWVIFGLIAGTIAKMIHPGRDPGGCIITMLLGIGGAVVGGFIGSFLGFGRVTHFSLVNLALAVVGALVLLVLYRAFADKKRREIR